MDSREGFLLGTLMIRVLKLMAEVTERLNKKLRSRGGECSRGKVGGKDETSGHNISVTVEAGYGHILDSLYCDFYFL